MIESTKSYKTSNGAVYITVEEAQIAEITLLAEGADGEQRIENADWPKWIVDNGEALLAILRTKARKPRTTPKAKRRGRWPGIKNATATTEPVKE